VEKVGSLYLDALMGRMSLYLWFAFLALGSVVAWDTNRIEDQNLRVLAKRKGVVEHSCFVLEK
jgi:hypothetical protein